jgi:hypothetical protein
MKMMYKTCLIFEFVMHMVWIWLEDYFFEEAY